MDECPLLSLLPVLQSSDERTLQENYERIIEWTRRMCERIHSFG